MAHCLMSDDDECRFMDAAMALVMSAALWGGAKNKKNLHTNGGLY
jgi:hypothetical protein